MVYGTVSCEPDNAEKKGGVVDDVKGFFGFGGKGDEQKPLQDDGSDGTSSTSSESAESVTGSSKAQTESGVPTSGTESKKIVDVKRKTETVYLDFTVFNEEIPSASATEVQRMKNRYGSRFQDCQCLLGLTEVGWPLLTLLIDPAVFERKA